MKNSQRGIGAIAIVVIVALVAVIGGGVYYSQKSASPEPAQEAMEESMESEMTADVSAEMDAEIGTLRTLFGLSQDLMCTFSGVEEDMTMSGTVYVSGAGLVRADTMSQASGQAAVESHMIKEGDMLYVWSGNQGAKMSLDAQAQAQAQGQSQNQAQANMDASVEYSCSDWTRDESKFVVPSNVTFIDLSAMMQGQIPAGLMQQ